MPLVKARGGDSVAAYCETASEMPVLKNGSVFLNELVALRYLTVLARDRFSNARTT